MNKHINTIISKKPNRPSFKKFTAQGYMNITSTSNNTKRMATNRYLIEKGIRELPCGSIPHSNVSNLTSDFLLGPNKCVAKMVVNTNPMATTNMIAIGK
jgi:hypothetical protein